MHGSSPSERPPYEAATGPSAGLPRKRGIGVGLVVVLALGLGFAGLLGVRVKQATARNAAVAKEREEAQSKVAKKEPAKTVRPTSTRWMPRVDITGTLKPWRDADVGFETPGRLVRVNVAVGDKVPVGHTLAVLDASRAAAQVGQAESQVAAAQANLALAQDNLKRTEALAATKSIPESQVEQARQQLALAKAQLDGAHASTRLAQSGAALQSISAPFAGIVTKAPTGIGSVVNAGVPLVHIEDTSRFRLSGTVGEEDVSLVANGAVVKILYRERVVDGKVVAIVPSLDQATRRAPVEIEVPNESASPLLAWSFVRARILGASETDALRLPALARRPGSQDEVVKVEGGKAKIAKVSFAVEEDGSLVVQRGLAPTDEVVLSPNPELRDGDPIEVASAAK
ncbi:MAG: efflux RND transporter periplasmic adaptor subunit [Deltaproteobacteria bacterium]|nr:efflux RND transporter periplasmic adaptor subunit [Deltaproteobacteria bacterium]